MSAGKYSFTIEQGATLQFEIQYKDSNKIPVDLTSYNGRLQVRPTVGSSDVYLTLSSTLQSDNTGLNFSGSNGSTPLSSGSIGIYVSAVTSSTLDFVNAYYDLEIYSGSGNSEYVVRLLEGKVTLSKEVTR
tara:strand:+ start:52 stop:444 length:393 start_codon:yes stop_codon:yes gene_type:complete